MKLTAPRITSRAGDDTPKWLMRGDGVDVSLCTCRHAVCDVNGAILLGPTAVTETVASGGSSWFSAYLTPAQTAALNATTSTVEVVWVMEIIGGVSVTPPYNREVHRRISLEPQNLLAV